MRGEIRTRSWSAAPWRGLYLFPEPSAPSTAEIAPAYAWWDLEIEGRVGVRRALEAAVRAPSAHNSQPWRFRPSNDRIELGWAADRELPHGDPHGRYLLIGLGAAAESAVLGASRASHTAEIEFELDRDRRRAASITFSSGAVSSTNTALADAVARRATSRSRYETRAVPQEVLSSLAAEAAAAGCELSIRADRGAIDGFADLVVEGTARNLSDPLVFEEFRRWLRLGVRAERSARDGLTGTALGYGSMGALASIVLSPAVMRMGRRVGLHRALADTQRKLARAAGAVCVLSAPSHEPADLFAGGRTMLRVWLASTVAGIQLHPMTSAMDHAETRTALADLFGLASDAPIVVCFRLGFGPAAPPSPRIPVDELIEGEGA